MKKKRISESISRVHRAHNESIKSIPALRCDWIFQSTFLQKTVTINSVSATRLILVIVAMFATIACIMQSNKILYQQTQFHKRRNETAMNMSRDEKSNFLRSIIDQRIKQLREVFAREFLNETRNTCSIQRTVGLQKLAGQSTSTLVQLSHGLWFSEVTGRTFILPPTLIELLAPFDMSLLSSKLCIAGQNGHYSRERFKMDHIASSRRDTNRRRMQTEILNEHKYVTFNSTIGVIGSSRSTANHTTLSDSSINVGEMSTGKNSPTPDTDTWQHIILNTHDAYVGQNIWLKSAYQPLHERLPLFNDELMVGSLTRHTRMFTAALWGSVKPQYINALVDTIVSHLDGNLEYISVHRRDLDGHCEEAMRTTRAQSPLGHGDFTVKRGTWPQNWSGRLDSLCRMPLSLIKAICNHFGHPCGKVHVAWDGKGEHEIKNDRLFVTCEQARMRQYLNPNILDMLLAMHADLFIMNPLSTWSWQVALVRSLLGLPTAPELDELPAAGLLSLWMYEESNRTDINYTSVWRDYKAKFWPSVDPAKKVIITQSYFSAAADWLWTLIARKMGRMEKADEW